MKSDISWDNLILTILLWIFIWQLFDTMIDLLGINQKKQIIIYIFGIIITSYLIYSDRYFKGN